MTAVGHVIAIPACPVRPKSGHSANARVYEYTPPRSRRGARRVRRRHHTDNTNTTTTQRQPRRTALVRAIVIRTIGEPYAHVRRLRLDATPAWEPQVFLDPHRFAQSIRGTGKIGRRRANSRNIGFPLFANRWRMVARPHSNAVLAASSRSSATWTWMRASRISGLSGIAVAILKQRAQLERWTQTTVRHLRRDPKIFAI